MITEIENNLVKKIQVMAEEDNTPGYMKAFSIYWNVNQTFIKNKETDIYQTRHLIHYERTKYLHIPCKLIGNLFDNGILNKKKFRICLLHYLIFNDKISLFKFKADYVRNILTKYNKNSLRLNELKLKKLLENSEYKLEDLFRINSDGNTVMYNLIKKEYFLPIMFLRYSKLVNEEEFEESEEHKRFRKIMTLIRTS